MSPLELHKVRDDAEFPEIMLAHREAFQSAENLRLWRLIYPEYSHNKDPPAAALADGISRTIALHRADPNSHWIKVVERETGRVAGAARWIICTANPFHQKPLVVDSFWWPVGDQREFADTCMRQFRNPRYEKMQQPHIFLNICFTVPEFRRRGVGRMLMDWGLHRADALALPVYIDATAEGRLLYATYGFEVVGLHQFDAVRENPSPTWKEMQQSYLPFSWTGMVRPPRGQRSMVRDNHEEPVLVTVTSSVDS